MIEYIEGNIFNSPAQVIVNTVNTVGVMGKGLAEITDGVEEKKKALSVLMKTQTGKDFEFEDKMVAFVNVIKITASSFTAKRRPLPKK